jgi:hypothetical protein
MRPEYLMASTPAGFAFAGRGAAGGGQPRFPPEGSDLLEHVLLPLAEELSLPIALKFGAARAVNPHMRLGGDGMEDPGGLVATLGRLCAAFPRVKFLATFLARGSQHEAAVLANKFRNLHLYGCWWFCNNPSIIDSVTAMRVELLGTAFTAQHSDARVLDQLVYKWEHSRAAIGAVLARKYRDLVATGCWPLTRADVDRDVHRLFGGAYEEFMAK